MQVVILSDVHGNLTAMRTVLADIHKQMPDYTVFAGDLCVFGAYPADTLALKRVAYNIQQEQAALAKSRPPKWERLSRVLDGELFLG